MFSIITSRTREVYTRRPTGPLTINEESAQLRGLVAWWPAHPFALDTGNNWKNALSTQYVLTNTNTVPLGVDQTMGRVFQFTAASSEFFKLSSAIITAQPLTLACWFTSDASTAYALMDLHNSAAATTRNCFTLLATGTTTDNRVIRGAVADGSSFGSVDSIGGYVVGEQSHACMSRGSANALNSYLNGRSKGTGTPTQLPSGINRVSIGARLNVDAGTSFHNGTISDARIYNYVLSDEAVYTLYDPETRWDLYYPAGRISYFFDMPSVAFDPTPFVPAYDQAEAAGGFVGRRII